MKRTCLIWSNSASLSFLPASPGSSLLPIAPRWVWGRSTEGGLCSWWHCVLERALQSRATVWQNPSQAFVWTSVETFLWVAGMKCNSLLGSVRCRWTGETWRRPMRELSLSLRAMIWSPVWSANLSTCPFHCAALSNVLCYALAWVVFTSALFSAIYPCTFSFLQPAGKETVACGLCVIAEQFVSLRKLLMSWEPMIPAGDAKPAWLGVLNHWERPSPTGDTKRQERTFVSSGSYVPALICYRSLALTILTCEIPLIRAWWDPGMRHWS